MASRGQIVAQLDIVVELAITDHRHGPIFVRKRLVTGLEVDDREPSHRKRDLGRLELSRRIGPAVPKCFDRGRKAIAAEPNSSRNPTHRFSPTRALGGAR
jgi:hypothetical protein